MILLETQVILIYDLTIYYPAIRALNRTSSIEKYSKLKASAEIRVPAFAAAPVSFQIIEAEMHILIPLKDIGKLRTSI